MNLGLSSYIKSISGIPEPPPSYSYSSPKSARLHKSPYLAPMILPRPPWNNVTKEYDELRARESKSKSGKRNNLLSQAGKSTVSVDLSYQPARVTGKTYLERMADEELLNTKYRKFLINKYRKENPMEPYKDSMIDIYMNKLIYEKQGRMEKQEHEIKSDAAARRRMFINRSLELEKIHQEQAMDAEPIYV